MEPSTSELTDLLDIKELKRVLGSRGPCLTLYMPVSEAPSNQGQNATRWKAALKTLEPKAELQGPEAVALLKSIGSWDEIYRDEAVPGKTLVVFRSPDVSTQVWLPETVSEQSYLNRHFYIRPLLHLLTQEPFFHILALSQNDVRLLRCTHSSSENVPFPADVIPKFGEYQNPAKPDHDRENLSSAGPSSGSSKGIVTGTDTEREDKSKYLSHFFKQIDRGVNQTLRTVGGPLVMVAVEKELALYRTVNSYPHLLDEDVHGAPNGLKGGEMHTRALEALKKHEEAQVEKALLSYNHDVGARASNRLKNVVTAAHEGRIVTLLVADSLSQVGTFDEATYTVKAREDGSPEEEDLLNDAVVQTIFHAGQVLVAPTKFMPNGAPLAAIFRY